MPLLPIKTHLCQMRKPWGITVRERGSPLGELFLDHVTSRLASGTSDESYSKCPRRIVHLWSGCHRLLLWLPCFTNLSKQGIMSMKPIKGPRAPSSVRKISTRPTKKATTMTARSMKRAQGLCCLAYCSCISASFLTIGTSETLCQW